MMPNLIYVSRSRMELSDDLSALRELHSAAVIRNAELGLTGFLVSTAAYFAQYLEGDQFALDILMNSIRGDERHTDIRETTLVQRHERRFPFWRMACFAPTSQATRYIEPMLKWYELGGTEDTTRELLDFMRGSALTVSGFELVA